MTRSLLITRPLPETVVNAARARFDVTVEIVETAVENVEFKVPRVVREPA